MHCELIGGPLTLEERENRDNTGRGDVDCELVLPDRELLHVFRQAAHDPSAVLVHVVGLALVLVGRVDDRDLEGASLVARSHSHVLGILRHCDKLRSSGGQASHSTLAAGGNGGLAGPQS